MGGVIMSVGSLLSCRFRLVALVIEVAFVAELALTQLLMVWASLSARLVSVFCLIRYLSFSVRV